jgi:uncharacterized repeat protein (TIGR03803 family)
MAANPGSLNYNPLGLLVMKTRSTSATLPAVGSAPSTKQIRQRLGRCALAIVLGTLTLPAHAQTFTVLYNFRGAADGANPQAGLVIDAEGDLYGTTVAGGTGCASGGGCGTVFKLTRKKEIVLHRFKDSPDGASPSGGLILDAAGNLYGVTSVGGANGAGALFKVDPRGAETVLSSMEGTGGGEPNGDLVMDANGNFYGTAIAGGTGNSGVVFEVGSDGTGTDLHSFCTRGGSRCTDGEEPSGGLVMDAVGNLYGTTRIDFGPKGTNTGALFKVTQSGKEATLHLFSFAKGSWPNGALIMDTAGNLYGTTLFGGTGICQSSDENFGCGTVFKVDPSGKETVLHNFCAVSGCADGASPSAGLSMDRNGNLYGTTLSGGTGPCTGEFSPGCGTVFELSANGTETVLHNFTGAAPDGAFPYSRLIMDANGNLYGTASAGGKFGDGIVFKVTP